MRKRFILTLTPEEVKWLEGIIRKRSEKLVRIERARYMLENHRGASIYALAKKYKTNRVKIQRVLHKAVAYGVKSAVDDLPRSGRKRVISDEARLWFLNIACQKPKSLGLEYEVWTLSALARYVQEHASAAGWDCFEKLNKGTVCKLLAQSNLKPHKVRYYQERREPDFEGKMRDVLCVYKEVELLRHKPDKDLVIVSYDAKPGIQAIGMLSEDLLPAVGRNGTILRDSDYIRYGTLSFLGGIDLFSGEIHGIVRDKHRSEEFIEFLEHLDGVYPRGIKIKLILDNHSTHKSKRTLAYLQDKCGRFEFVFTPRHGSWLNLIEVFFSKLARTLLRHIRVKSKVELKERILNYIAELNREPVIFRWKYKLNEI